MSEFDDILKKMREGLGQMAEDAQQKYNELVEYLDSHDAEQIKGDFKKMPPIPATSCISMATSCRRGRRKRLL